MPSRVKLFAMALWPVDARPAGGNSQLLTQLSPHHDVGRSKKTQCIPTPAYSTITRITICPKGKIDEVGGAREAEAHGV
jgi:hypothetical protein